MYLATREVSLLILRFPDLGRMRDLMCSKGSHAKSVSGPGRARQGEVLLPIQKRHSNIDNRSVSNKSRNGMQK